MLPLSNNFYLLIYLKCDPQIALIYRQLCIDTSTPVGLQTTAPALPDILLSRKELCSLLRRQITDDRKRSGRTSDDVTSSEDLIEDPSDEEIRRFRYKTLLRDKLDAFRETTFLGRLWSVGTWVAHILRLITGTIVRCVIIVWVTLGEGLRGLINVCLMGSSFCRKGLTPQWASQSEVKSSEVDENEIGPGGLLNYLIMGLLLLLLMAMINALLFIHSWISLILGCFVWFNPSDVSSFFTLDLIHYLPDFLEVSVMTLLSIVIDILSEFTFDRILIISIALVLIRLAVVTLTQDDSVPAQLGSSSSQLSDTQNDTTRSAAMYAIVRSGRALLHGVKTRRPSTLSSLVSSTLPICTEPRHSLNSASATSEDLCSDSQPGRPLGLPHIPEVSVDHRPSMTDERSSESNNRPNGISYGRLAHYYVGSNPYGHFDLYDGESFAHPSEGHKDPISRYSIWPSQMINERPPRLSSGDDRIHTLTDLYDHYHFRDDHRDHRDAMRHRHGWRDHYGLSKDHYGYQSEHMTSNSENDDALSFRSIPCHPSGMTNQGRSAQPAVDHSAAVVLGSAIATPIYSSSGQQHNRNEGYRHRLKSRDSNDSGKLSADGRTNWRARSESKHPDRRSARHNGRPYNNVDDWSSFEVFEPFEKSASRRLSSVTNREEELSNDKKSNFELKTQPGDRQLRISSPHYNSRRKPFRFNRHKIPSRRKDQTKPSATTTS